MLGYNGIPNQHEHGHGGRMKASTSAGRVMQFRAENSDLPTDLGGVRLQLLQTDNGRVQLSIVIDPETTMDSVKQAWPVVREWQGRLERFQEQWFSERDILLFNLWVRKLGGRSYASLAQFLNETIEGHIVNAHKLLSESLPELTPEQKVELLLDARLQRIVSDTYSMAEPLFELFVDSNSRALLAAVKAIAEAQNVFECLNSKSARFEDYLPDAVQRVSAGDPIWGFPAHPPFTGDIVRDRLDYFSKRTGFPSRGGKR